MGNGGKGSAPVAQARTKLTREGRERGGEGRGGGGSLGEGRWVKQRTVEK